MSAQRFKKRYEFWLELAKVEQEALAEQIDALKEQRQFAPAVRGGLELILSLGQGNTEVLTRMFPFLKDAILLFTDLSRGKLDSLLYFFPWVEAAIMNRYAAPHKQEVDDLRRELDELKMRVQAGAVEQARAGQGPKAIAVPAIPGPAADDDEIELTIKKAKSDGKSAQNFLDSAFSLLG